MSLPPEHLERFQQQEAQAPPAPEPEAEKPSPEAVALAELREENRRLAQRLENAEKNSNEALRAAAQRPPAEPQKEPDWDSMTTKDIVGVVIGEMRRGNEVMQQQFGMELAKIRLETQIERAIEKHPDFMKFSQEIVEITKEKNGTITPVEAYLLVKARLGQESETTKSEPKKVSPTGVRPSSASSGKPAPAPANSKEAATRAYKQAFGG